MGTNYFTPENSWRHLFFITGLTADEFYTDGGLKLNIEQLTYLELKKSGYERVVFYDKDNKLYCYDDESYSLLRVNGRNRNKKEDRAQETATSLTRQNRGLRRGRHAHSAHSVSPSSTQEKVESVSAPVTENTGNGKTWVPGNKSGILIQGGGKGPLHLGMRDNTFVKRQIDAYMYDALIKTAVVINDPTSFLREFGEEPMHSVTAGYERMGADNENILVFLYTDEALGNIYRVDQFHPDTKNVNQIHISCPNASEIKNMLMYFRVNYGLKIKMKDLREIALALRQAMALSTENIRIKEVYSRLKSFGSQKEFTVDSCFALLHVKKPSPARVQLENLIGMNSVKEVLTAYDTENPSNSSVYDYLTASRLQPDKESPKRTQEMIHFVLTGNPGTGKTTVAELIGQLFYEMGYLEHGHVVQADRSKLVAGYVGQTAILVQRQVEAAMGGVLFIDEAYSLKRQKNNDNDFGQEAIDTLCKLMDQYKGKFIVVAAGYPREMEIFLNSNPGLASRFKQLHIDDYSAEEMAEIFKYHVKRKNAVISEGFESKLSDFCENWVNLAGENWGNAREAVNLVNDMVRAWKNDPDRQTRHYENEDDKPVLDIKHIPSELLNYLRPVAEMRTEALHRLNQMTGLQGVKDTVERLRRRMLSGDMKEPGHYMFTGNPGTGKTTIARYMGQILRNLGMLKRGHMVEYTASELMTEVFNDENRGDFFAVAKKAFDGVLFIDEAYQLVSDTTGRGHTILSALLPFMENYRKNLCVIAAGYEDEMQDFVDSNPGYKNRFSETIHFDNYSGQELCSILIKLLEEKGITATDEYKEFALRALTRYVAIHGKEKDFGNARYIRNVFLPDSLDVQTDRLIRLYGDDFPRELKKTLTSEDIPADLVRFTKTPLEKTDHENESSAMDDINHLIGFQDVKTKLMDLLTLKKTAEEYGREDLLEDINLHWVLRGNPGTGKTTVAELIGKVYKEMGLLSHGRTVKVTRSDLVAGYVGQTAIKTQKCIDRAMGGVLFIDEAYSLKRAEVSGNDFGQEAIDTLLEQMSARNGEFAVIVAGYPKEMEVFLNANPGFESRFDDDFLLQDYTADELLQIFKLKCKKKKFYLKEETSLLIKQLFENMISAKLKNWANGREAENLEKRMRNLWARNPVSKMDPESGEMRSYYRKEHIPDRYKAYLSNKDVSEKETDGKSSQENMDADFSIPAEKLTPLPTDFQYEEGYLDQVKSVVFIRTKTREGVSSGSGSIITKDGYILTCSHVISGQSDIQIRLKEEKNGIMETKWVPAKVVWEDSKIDAAVLKIPDGTYPSLALRSLETDTHTGEAIYLWGYPFGGRLSDDLNELQPSLFQGYISSIQTKNGLERINTNMEAKRGCSGGPVFSKKDGTILGILCGSQTVGDEGLMEEINYVLPVKYILEKVFHLNKASFVPGGD